LPSFILIEQPQFISAVSAFVFFVIAEFSSKNDKIILEGNGAVAVSGPDFGDVRTSGKLRHFSLMNGVRDCRQLSTRVVYCHFAPSPFLHIQHEYAIVDTCRSSAV